MPDVFTKKKRSEVMSKIRSRGNIATELRMIGLMRENAIHGWRRHLRVFGHPDFVFRQEGVAVFIDGCFWHCCPKCKLKPRTNAEFWSKKLSANQRRDRLVARTLRRAGWKVVRIWEHEVERAPQKAIDRLRAGLRS
jgi:DNA mismatch endonuclease (patch repair protein)